MYGARPLQNRRQAVMRPAKQGLRGRKIRPGIARCVRSGWNPEDASWSAAYAGITCPVQITINARRLYSVQDRFAEKTKNRYASRFRPGLPPDSCTDEEELK